MKKNKKIIFCILFVLTILVVGEIAVRFSLLEEWRPPIKPEKVPKDAIWAGGYDGGYFFQLESEYSDTCRFAIYGEYDGNIVYDGYFYCAKNDFERISKIKWSELITCYNGVYIFMKNPNNKKIEIVWRKVMPDNVPKDAYWVENDNGGCFLCLYSVFSDTSHFVIYDDITGELLCDGLFSCNKNDFETIAELEWTNLFERYNGNEIIMANPNDTNRHIMWNLIK